MTETSSSNNNQPLLQIYASYAAAGGMVICFAIVLIKFLIWLFPTMPTGGLVLVCALTVLESFFSFWLVKHLPSAQNQIVFYHITELLILLIVLKLFSDLHGGLPGLWNNLILWPVHFPFNILNGRFWFTVVPAIASWWAGSLFAADLALLGAPPPAAPGDGSVVIPVRSLILRRFLNLGIFVIILAGIPAQTVFQFSLPITSSSAMAVLAFFVFGIILLSLTRYITLITSWWKDRLQIPAQIPRRWFAYSAAILVVLVFLIIWLPTHYEMGIMGLIDTLNAGFALIYEFVMIIYGIALVIFSFITSLIFRNSSDAQTSIAQATPAPVIPPAATASTMDWTLVKSILLWGSLIVLAFIALRQFIAFNRDFLDDLRQFRPIRWLVTVWIRFRSSFKKANKSVGVFIQNSLKRLRSLRPEAARPGQWDFINPRRLTPRQKVIFYYLALTRRANEAGLPRQDAQTPYEYAHSLKSRLTEGQDGVDGLTDSFIEARYSRHEIPISTARRAESIWESIRRVLRNVRKSRRDSPPNEN